MVTLGGHDDGALGILEPIASLADRRTEPLILLLEDILVLTLGDSIARIEDVCWSITSVLIVSGLKAWAVSNSAKSIDHGAHLARWSDDGRSPSQHD